MFPVMDPASNSVQMVVQEVQIASKELEEMKSQIILSLVAVKITISFAECIAYLHVVIL